MNWTILLGVGGAVVGVVASVVFQLLLGKGKLSEAHRKAQSLVEEADGKAKAIRKEAELEAKDLQLKARANFEREISDKRRELSKFERRLQAKEDTLEKRFGLQETKEEELMKNEKKLEEKKEQLNRLENQYQELLETTQKTLERAAGITKEEAMKQLKEALLDDSKQELAASIKRFEEETKAEAERKAKYIIATTVERIASEYVSERSISVVNLPSEDMKGRIIGREGRNIRAFEAATGIDVIVDDTPEAVVLSGYNPVRR